MGMGVGEAILAAIVLIILLGFTASAALDEMATNQQITNFIEFRSQVASVCEMVKVNKNTPYESNKEYIVLYPYYDIRFYNKTADMLETPEVAQACNGDKCACLVKMGKAGWGDTASCYLTSVGANSVLCVYKAIPIEAVLSCFNMQQLGCDYQLWFAKGKEKPIKNETGIETTCKFEGAVTWDRTGFFYDKRSEFCEKGKR